MSEVEILSGGFWSSAYGVRAGDDELVLRIGSMRDGFEADRFAMAWSSPALPVPEVYAVGDLPGGRAFAISRRHHGRFLEDVGVDEVAAARPMLRSLLDALRTTPVVAGEELGSWRQWLLDGLEDDESSPSGGWRSKLRAVPEANALFERAASRVRSLVDACPDDRHELLHGDLLHRNVLVSEDASRVEAVFSWKCATRGDALFDVAWCTFWGATFHPGIAAVDAWSLVEHDDDAALRHHCYELHIGATHLGWYAWTGEEANLARLVDHVSMLLERGPRD